MMDHSPQADLLAPNEVATFQQLRQPAQLLLPPHIERERPISIDYLGLRLYYTLEYTPSGRYPGGELCKITFTYRDEPANKRSRTGYGNIVVRKSYTPACALSIPRGAVVPESVVTATLDRVFFRFFFPELVEKRPKILSAARPLKLMGPYALLRLQKTISSAESTRLAQVRAMEKLLSLFGTWQLADVTPENCAPIMLERLTQTEFKDCVRLLHQLFAAIFVPYVVDKGVWTRYHTPRFGKPYSPVARTRKVFLREPLCNNQCCDIIKRVEDNLTDDDTGRLYLAALLMLLLCLEPAEVCALTQSSVISLKDYPGYSTLKVGAVVETVGNRKTLTASGERRQRERQHHIRTLDTVDELQARLLPAGKRIKAIWDTYWDVHPDHPGEYLLFDPRNRNRLMSPELLDEWLDTAFEDIVPNKSFRLPGSKVYSKYHISDFFAATAECVWSEKCAMPEEGVRRLMGLKPQHTDAQHYIDFQCESMMVNFCESQDRWLAELFGTEADVGRSVKRYAVAGVPSKRLHARFVVELPPQGPTGELRGAIEIPYAGSFYIVYHANEAASKLANKKSSKKTPDQAGREKGTTNRPSLAGDLAKR